MSPARSTPRAAPIEVTLHGQPDAIDAAGWDRLVEARASASPFMRHAYLAALDASRSAVAATGWQPQWLAIERAGALAAACPAYLKDHSYGEYVFDWAWAEAYGRHGLPYYPKLLVAVPFTPVPGPRLLGSSHDDRVVLLQALEQIARRANLSSAHVLFLDEEDTAAARAAGWMVRRGVQFHWTNRTPQPYADFADFLASLQREKRKKIQQERRRVAEAGVTIEVLEGAAIGSAHWDYFHRCYTLTYRAHHSTPYLKRDFFARMARSMARNWVLFLAHRAGERVAASLIAVDPEQRVAFGRYWGATEAIPLLHFEACYYRPLEWCIANGYRRFEGGAQGEHKMARGLMPVPTASAHWLAHPQFARAVEDFLAREGAGIEHYLDELTERAPFKRTP
jgi:predicted N-acyltransferase